MIAIPKDRRLRALAFVVGNLAAIALLSVLLAACGRASAATYYVDFAGGSDTATLDNVFELLVRAGRDAPMVKSMLIPESVGSNATMPKAKQLAANVLSEAGLEELLLQGVELGHIEHAC